MKHVVCRSRWSSWPVAISISCAVGACIGAAVWWAVRHDDTAFASTTGFPRDGGGAVLRPDGSWCSEYIETACVSANGDIDIPSGEAAATLTAFFHICEKIPGAPDACSFVFLKREREFQTNPVSGRMSADEALTRMLEGSGLAATGSIKRGVGFRVRE